MKLCSEQWSWLPGICSHRLDLVPFTSSCPLFQHPAEFFLLMRPINNEQAVVERSGTEGNVIHGPLSSWLEQLRLDWFISYHSALPPWLFLLGEYSRIWLKVGLFVQIVTVYSEFQYKGSDICKTYKTKRTQSYHLLNLFISVILQISELFRHYFFVKNDGWIHQDIIKWPLPDP